MKLDVKFVDDLDDSIKKSLCLLWGFPISYVDAAPEDIALFLNNKISYVVMKEQLTSVAQRTAAQINKQANESLQALEQTQEKIKFKAVSAK